MLSIEINSGDLELGKTSDEIHQDALRELSRTEPNSVETKLAEDGQVLDNIQSSVNDIHLDLKELRNEVKMSQKLKQDVAQIKEQIDVNNKLLLSIIQQQNLNS